MKLQVNAANILKHTLAAREIRSVLGIDTSRSVNHHNVQKDVIEEEEEEIRRSDKRRSMDSGLRVPVRLVQFIY